MEDVTLKIPEATTEDVVRSVEGFFALDFKPQQKGGRGDLKRENVGDGDVWIHFTEDVNPHPLENLLHIVLIFVTMGLWLIVWGLIALGRRNRKRRVSASIFESEGGYPFVVIGGDTGWTQSVVAHIRRDFPGVEPMLNLAR